MRATGFILRQLWRRPGRSLLTVLGVGIAVGAFLALEGVSGALQQSWRESARGRGSHLTVAPRGVIAVLAETLPEARAAALAKLPGVAEVAGELAHVVQAGSTPATLPAVGWPPGAYLWDSLPLLAGTRPAPGQPELMLGRFTAALLGLGAGGSLELRGRRFRVSGVFSGGGRLADALLVLPLDQMQALKQTPGRVSWFALRLERPDDPAARRQVKEEIARLFPDLQAADAEEFLADHPSLQAFQTGARAISLMALGIAFLGITNTLLMSVLERTREIGLLGALGWRRARVVRTILAESLFLSAAGGVAGVGLGVAALNLITAHPEFRNFLDVSLTGWLLLRTALAATLVGGLGAIYPALRAAGLRPVEALRRE